MSHDERAAAPGDYVGGRFLPPEGAPLASYDPARGGQVVFATAERVERVALAVEAAQAAQPAWRALGLSGRWEALGRFRAAIEQHRGPIAEAIVREMGKIRGEALLEVGALLGRFDLSLDRVKNDLKEGPLPGFPGEALRWQPHGVVGVIGPFNFPVHLSHAHIVPALLLGNTVVLKPSEITPLAALRYLEAAHAAGLPPGVLNLVQGRGASGTALVAHPDVKAIAFTGSWPVGRRILEATLDKPETLLALEMGGKNVSVVCEDADLRQAAHEIVIGGYLTTGQRCTCTDRVLVHRKLAGPLIDALARLVRALRFGDPDDPRSFAGPMATEGALAKFERAIAAARSAGADAVVPGARLPGGAFRSGSLHVLPEGRHDVPGYTDVELFGPDLGVELVESDEEAIALVAGSPYGFACSVFTASEARFERYRAGIRLGLLNQNRSTNQASPRLPFGGTGRSGNFRPAGAFAARNLAVPVAVQSNPLFSFAASPHLRAALPPPDLALMESRHALEEAAEAAAEPASEALAPGGVLPASSGWTERLFAGERLVRFPVPLVVDPRRSGGAWLVSVDAAPLVLLDAQRGLGGGEAELAQEVAAALVVPPEPAAVARELASALALPSAEVAFTDGPHEAVEKAVALLGPATPDGRLLVFAGARHGRVRIPSGGRTELAGLGALVLPWPTEARPSEPPDPALEAAAAAADRPDLARRLAALLSGNAASVSAADSTSARESVAASRIAELRVLVAVLDAVAAGGVLAVLAPLADAVVAGPASHRLHRALRHLCRGVGVPLLLDASGLPLSSAREAASLLGPDALIFGGPGLPGVVLGRLVDPEPSEVFPPALARLRWHAAQHGAQAAASDHLAQALAPLVAALDRRWPDLALRPRAHGGTLAFELPSSAHAAAYLGQARWRGVLPEVDGCSVRHRLHAGAGAAELEALARAVHRSLAWLEAHPGASPPAWEELPGARPGLPASTPRVALPSASAPAPVRAAFDRGALDAALALGGGLPQRVTPGLVRALEWVGAIAPDLPHLFPTPGRDALADELVRLLRAARPAARTLLGLRGAYLGHTTAAARALSDPALLRAPSQAGARLVPHPAEIGDEACLAALRAAIAEAGPDAVLGVVVESVGERTGWVAGDGFLAGLAALRAETGVPIALFETASAYHRSGRGPFHASAAPLLPDALLWAAGGPLGFAHLSPALFAHAGSPGHADELAAAVAHHRLRAARGLDVAAAARALEAVLARRLAHPVHGVGLYRVIAAGAHADGLASRLAAADLLAARHPGGRLVLAPPLDRLDEALARLDAALA